MSRFKEAPNFSIANGEKYVPEQRKDAGFLSRFTCSDEQETEPKTPQISSFFAIEVLSLLLKCQPFRNGDTGYSRLTGLE